MSGPSPSPGYSRLLELLADRALCGLSEAEQRELEVLCREHAAMPPCNLEFCELDAAAGEVAAAMAGGETETCPAVVRAGLEKAADQWCHEHCAITSRLKSAAGLAGSGVRVLAAVGWLAAAACLALAVWAWGTRPAGMGSGARMTPAQRVAAFEGSARDIARSSFGPFQHPETGAAPALSGVTGHVVWSESGQGGFVCLKGLKRNDPGVERYQLWIVDSRGMDQRISGGLFDAEPDPTTGETIAAIEPAIPVRGAALVAVTIEPPGGVWVSDLSRRVVVAKLEKQAGPR